MSTARGGTAEEHQAPLDGYRLQMRVPWSPSVGTRDEEGPRLDSARLPPCREEGEDEVLDWGLIRRMRGLLFPSGSGGSGGPFAEGHFAFADEVDDLLRGAEEAFGGGERIAAEDGSVVVEHRELGLGVEVGHDALVLGLEDLCRGGLGITLLDEAVVAAVCG